MWISYLFLSISSLLIFVMIGALLNNIMKKKGRIINFFNIVFAGVFVSSLFMFMPIHLATNEYGIIRSVILSIFNSMQIFALGTEFEVVNAGIPYCPDVLSNYYQIWAAFLFVLAPIFTFGFVLSLFKNISAFIKYVFMYFKRMYIFSELNEKSLNLACDIKKNNPDVCIVFNRVVEDNENLSSELVDCAKQLGAICFKKDILGVKYSYHSASEITFFSIDSDETENLNQTLSLIELYKTRKNTHLYVFSTRIESELLLTAVDKGEIKVRRVNEVQSLINRILFDRGEIIFDSAIEAQDGIKDISAVVVGMGRHGTEMVKALSWFGQMDGYRTEITAFDADPLAEQIFVALAPELMSDDYNGVFVEGESQYTIKIHSGVSFEGSDFAAEISKFKRASYVFVALGNDDVNIRTAVNLRMLFERIGVHPVIQAVLSNSQQKNALTGIKNYRGQEYDIDFVGDIASSFVEKVIIDSELEEDALQRHLKWGKEEEFWAYEYNYRSSIASAIHMKARIKCGIPGANKTDEELTAEERDVIMVLEHKRWNAYMRAEGYVYSGSPHKSSRNDLAKMHHDLVDFSSLSDVDKQKDIKIGTK